MWAFLLVAVVFILGKFFFDRGQQRVQVIQEGGMSQKYITLITAIFTEYETSERTLESKAADLLVYRFTDSESVTRFTIMQCYGNVQIIWEYKNAHLPMQKLEWYFPEHSSQSEIFAQIKNDISKNYTNYLK